MFSSSSSPIDRLPVELVARIFVLGAALDVRDSPFLLKPADDCAIPPASSFQLVVTHVCAHWRHVALHTPALWTTIRFREPAHLPRARTYLARCASSVQLLDILVDTVAPAEHIPGITLSTEEFHPIFDIISPHVNRWRALFLKVRDNVCKAGARARLSSCGAAPNLETLQLYHFEDFGSTRDLVRATHLPPVMVFENTLPRLRYVSLIGVNLPWRASPFLRNLHQLELALHRETVRLPYKYWERILRSSPDLQKLALHYSGPRVPPSWPSAMPAVGGGGDGPSPTEDNWPDGSDRAISLPCLVELSLTDLDPDYLCLLLDHLALPAVTTLALELLDQDYTPFVHKLSGEIVQIDTDEPGSVDGQSDDNANGDAEGEGETQMQPYFRHLERLVLSALECNAESWRMLLRGLTGLRELEVDFARVGAHLLSELVQGWSGSKEERESWPILPALTVFKFSNLSGKMLARLITSREKSGLPKLRWMAQWCERRRGRDRVLDALIDRGWEGEHGKRVQVEAWMEDDIYDDEEEDECGEDGEEEDEDGDEDVVYPFQL